ncbi:MAG: sugar ABC transporter substrate-binding protein [Planctomycetota bacterium]|jgi:simple sugar transport system substrate-binding protein/ribose transport system substrate-binding protein|nr:sugar ABC transporter substrate-binding protein [Planctomycetota bacterium]
MKRTLLLAVGALAVAAGAACAGQVRITVVYHDTGLEFGQVIKNGSLTAGKDLGADVEFVGPIGIKVDEQVAIIENAITKRVDGLAVSNVNGEALNPMIDKAIAAGIPTVTFNSDADGSKRMAFYGQNLVEGGIEQAAILSKYMGGKGRILIITGEAAASWSQDREKGVREGMKKFPGVEIVNTISTGWEEQSQYAAIENAIIANPDLTGIASLDAATTPATGRALLRLGKAGAIKHVGHDLVPETLDNIKAGGTNASLSQNPFQQGYKPVEGLYRYVVEKKPPVSVDTGILRVDEKNIDEYLQKLEDGEPIG